MKYRLILLAIGALIMTSTLARADERACLKQEAIAAEAEAATIHTWTEAFDSYRKYAHCDHASIREGYNDSIGRLLAHEWGSVGMLETLSRKSRGFEDFVVGHVGEATLPEHVMEIQANASQRCPASSRRLCKRLIDALRIQMQK